MKRVIVFIWVLFVAVSCEDDLIIDQPAVSFYPTVALSVTEGDGVTNTVRLEATANIESQGSIEISIKNGDFLDISPAPNGGKLVLEMNPGETSTSFNVEALSDNIPFNYTATFEVTSVSGGIRGIGVGEFELFVESLDQECPQAESLPRTDIGEARDMDGQTVTLVATVNTPDYGFSSGQFFIEDETGGINIFHSGQQGIVKPGNVVQITGEIGEFAGQVQISPNTLEVVCDIEGIPQAVEVDPSDLTLDSEFQGRRVLLKGVTINTSEWPVLPISSGSGANVSASFGGVDFTIRIDRGESFYDGSDTPASNIDLYGIMGRFNDDLQIMPFFEGDVVGEGSGGGGGGGGGDTYALPFLDNFEACTDDFATPEMWIEEFGTGSKTDRGWGCRSEGVGGSRAARASAFGGATGSDDAWLISAKKFDLTSVSTAYLQFQMKSEFDGPGTINIYWSDDYAGSGNPEGSTWNELTDVTSQLPTKGSGSFETITSDMSAATGAEVYLAFRYSGAMDSDAASFSLDEVSVTEDDPGNGGGGGGNNDSIDISEARGKSGETVKITGIVTTPDYGFNHGQFFVQDATAGINVIYFDNNGVVSEGDEVEITGSISEFEQQIQIQPSSVSILSSGNSIPAAISITGSQLTLDSDLQGSRIKLSSVTLSDPSQWPTTAISEGSGVNVDAMFDGVTFQIRIDRGESFFDESPAPSEPFELTGILSRFGDNIQIMPFAESDIN